MERVDITIIGAGVVGLAVARELARADRTVAVLERHDGFGRETSSRNSEVIHAGLYYPTGSLKARLCVAGNPLVYAYCERRGVPHRRLGKIVVATEPGEEEALAKLHRNGASNGAELEWLDAAQVKALEPEIRCRCGLYSPRTGIFDTHAFMQALAGEARAQGALLIYGAEVAGAERLGGAYRLAVRRDDYRFESRLVVNCAGLSSDRVAALPGLDAAAAGYRLHYCRGDYFRAARPVNVSRLAYPVPEHDARGLGVHLTKDLAGGTRFGPDATYVPEPAYEVDAGKRDAFWEAIRRYLPGLDREDLIPDTAGVRPKLQGPGDGFRDFVIRHEADRGLPGWYNLIGIESPGLTASLAIANEVAAMMSADGVLV